MFQPGNKLGTGRPKGSLNKKTLALQALFDQHNFNPAKMILELLPKLDTVRKLEVCLKLMNFIYPQISHEKIDIETVDINVIDENKVKELIAAAKCSEEIK